MLAPSQVDNVVCNPGEPVEVGYERRSFLRVETGAEVLYCRCFDTFDSWAVAAMSCLEMSLLLLTR